MIFKIKTRFHSSKPVHLKEDIQQRKQCKICEFQSLYEYIKISGKSPRLLNQQREALAESEYDKEGKDLGKPHDVHLLVLSSAPLCLKSPTSLVSMAWQTKNRNPATALSSRSCTHTGRLRRALVFTAGGAAGLEAARGTAATRGTDRVSLQEDELVSLNSV